MLLEEIGHNEIKRKAFLSSPDQTQLNQPIEDGFILMKQDVIES